LARDALPPGSVLFDLFCGLGTMLPAALDRSIGVVGIDKEEKYLRMAAKRLRRR
jgi:DNA modification methylase